MAQFKKNKQTLWTPRNWVLLIAVLLVVVLVFVGMDKGPEMYRQHRLSKYDQQTHVFVDDFTPIRQAAGRSGKGVVVVGYEVSYQYSVQGTRYEKSEFISTNLDNARLLRGIRGEEGVLVFRFESSNPKIGLLSVADTH